MTFSQPFLNVFQQQPICVITAYDYPTAKLAEAAGVKVLLVGDSLGMIALGYPDTTHVTMPEMLHHTRAVSRGVKQAFIISDLPFQSYTTPEQCVENAKKLIDAGANAVKLEGAIYDCFASLQQQKIPTVAHLGMLPQSIKVEGKYRKKGRTAAERKRLITEAKTLSQYDCLAIILEGVIPEVATAITQAADVPTIGIGCGDNSMCCGEVAVISDIVGSYPWFVPSFAKSYGNVATEIEQAIRHYQQDVAQKYDISYR